MVQWEDGGPWRHGVIVEMNSINHRGHSYTVWVKKTRRLIMHNMKQIQFTKSTEQKLKEQIRKAEGQVKDVFIYTLPDGANGPPKLQAYDYNTEVKQGETQVHEEGEKRESTSPSEQSMRSHSGSKGNTTPPTEVTCRASPGVTENYCNPSTSVTDRHSTVDASADGSRCDMTSIRSGQTICKPIRLRTDS